MNILESHPSILCLEETLFYTLNTLLAPKCQYLGNDLNLPSLEALKNMFEIAATNLKKAHSKRDPIILTTTN